MRNDVLPENGLSVPFSCVTWYCKGVSRFLSSPLSIFSPILNADDKNGRELCQVRFWRTVKGNHSILPDKQRLCCLIAGMRWLFFTTAFRNVLNIASHRSNVWDGNSLKLTCGRYVSTILEVNRCDGTWRMINAGLLLRDYLSNVETFYGYKIYFLL